MKKLSKLAIFFIVCGGVFLLGLICAIGGAASGGVDGFEKVADDFDWVQGSPGERVRRRSPRLPLRERPRTRPAEICGGCPLVLEMAGETP